MEGCECGGGEGAKSKIGRRIQNNEECVWVGDAEKKCGERGCEK